MTVAPDIPQLWLPPGVEVPDQRSVVYPGNDAWLGIDPATAAPSGDPAWLQIETVPDTGAIPAKVVSQTTTPPTISTAQSVFGGSSLLAGGTGYALTTPDHADWNLGAGDFTIEARFRWSVIRKALFAQMATDGSDRAWEWTMDAMASGTPGFSFYYNTTATATWDVQVDRGFVVTVNQWYHMAIARQGTALRMFVDGAQVGADYAIGAAVIRDSNAPLRILGDARTTGNDYQGYVDELRISKGIARYTGAYTIPAAAFTRDQYTVLLMHFDGANGSTSYVDSSGAAGTPFDPGSDPAWVEIER